MVGPWLAWSIRRRREINILDFFLRRAVIPSLGATTRLDAIRELCDAVAEQEAALDGEALYAAVCAREDLMGTGTGHGVAIPHARLEGLPRPLLTFGRSVAGIEWDSADGLPAHLVFLLLTPVADEGLQLQILAGLARGLMAEQARKRLAGAQGGPQVWAALSDAFGLQNLVRASSA